MGRSRDAAAAADLASFGKLAIGHETLATIPAKDPHPARAKVIDACLERRDAGEAPSPMGLHTVHDPNWE